MPKKNIILIASVIVTFIIVAICGFFIFQKVEKDKKARLEKEAIEAEKKELSAKSESFAIVWGTYDYITYPDKYLLSLKPYLSSSFSYQLTNQAKEMGFIKSVDTIKKYQQKVEAKPIRIISVNKVQSGYLVKILVSDSLKVKTKTTTKERTLDISWKKEKDEFRVFDARYEY